MKQVWKNILRRYPLIGGWLLLLAVSGSVLAQNRPVTATLQLTPPYSVYLADYARPGSEQMRVYLLLRDLSEPQYDVRLRLTIEGSGIRLQTNPNYLPPPITLEGGAPLNISGETLAPYLNSHNLLFAGITQAQYEQRRALPEGFYQFTVEVLDYRRTDRVLSRPATFMAWFTLNEPPRITAPICGSTLPLQEPTHILFQWMNGGNISPESAFNTEYELTLVEIYPSDRNPEDAIRSSIPLLQTITTETSYLYGITEAALIPGQKYAFRVRAVDIEGRAIYKNEGYSPVCTFTYGDGLTLTPPDGIRVYAENARKALINWHLSIDPESYRVEYRRKTDKGEEALNWFSKETQADQIILRDLEPETTYEVRIASLFSDYVSRYSNIRIFTTPAIQIAACGEAPPPPITASTVPLSTAMAGQYWQVGDFEMQVRQVRGGDGVFSGWGVMSVPYLSMQIPVKFESVWVDEDYNVVQGEVVALSEELDEFRKRWEEVNPLPEEEEPIADGQQDSETYADSNNPTQEGKTANITLAYEIVEVYVNEQGQVVAIDEHGDEAIVAEEAPQEEQVLAVNDSKGSAFTVDSAGKVSKETGNSNKNDNPSTQDQPDPLLAKQDALISAVLEEFEQDLEAWLSVNGKGPLDKREISALLSLPDYVPRDAEMVEGIKTYVSQIKKTSSVLVEKISEDEADRATLEGIAQKLDIQQPIKSQLEEEEWEEVKTIGGEAATQAGLVHWFTEKPYWERAAYVMEEYLESQGIYESVGKECTGNDCKVWAELNLSEDATLSQEITFDTSFSPQETFELLVFTYNVPFWEAKQAFTDGFWEAALNWVRIQEDKIVRQEGWAVAYANFVADVVNAPYGAVHGWITGQHWRTGEELAWWEHALGILDVIPGEALAKAGITALVIKIGGKTIDLAKLSQATRKFIIGARAAGLRLVVRTADEIILYGKQGTQQIGRFVNGVLQDIYWIYRGEKILAKLAGVKYLIDNKTVEGTLEIVENGGNKIGFKFPKTGNVFSNIKNPFIIDGMPDAAGQFRQLSLKVDDKVKNLRAGNFAKRTGDKINHYITQDGQYYIKHDPDTRELLLIDVKKKEYLGYAIDEVDPTSGLKLVQNSIAEEFEKVISIWKRLKGLDDATEIFIKGKRILLPKDKITLILGKYRIPSSFDYITTSEILEELGLNHLKYWELSKNLTPSTQRIHMLNVPNDVNIPNGKTWWTAYNEQLIDDIIKNPDKYNIVILTDVAKPNATDEVIIELGGAYADEIMELNKYFGFEKAGDFWTITNK